MNNFCVKCNNSYGYEIQKDKLIKICHICKHFEIAQPKDYKIFSENFKTDLTNYEYFLNNITNDITYPTIKKNNKNYTIFVEKNTLRRIYICHEDNKVYYSI